MDAVVANFAVAPMPMPVPVVVHDVVFERSPRRRALPEIPIQPRRYRSVFADPDRSPPIVVPGPRVERLADLARMNFPDRLDDGRPRSPLRSHLHDAVVVASRLHRPFTFGRRVAARLFHVNVFAGRAAHDRCRCVPMIGCGDDQHIDVFVIEQIAKVGDDFWFLAARLFHVTGGTLGSAGIDIADVGDAGVRSSHHAFDDVAATTVDAHHADRDSLVGRCRRFFLLRLRKDLLGIVCPGGRRDRCGGLQKQSSI